SGDDTYQWYNVSSNLLGQTSPNFTKIASSLGGFTYYVVVTDSNHGTGQSSTASVTVLLPLSTSLVANRSTIIKGQSVLFANTTNGGAGGYKYSYSINNSVGVTQNGNEFTFADVGKYNVTLTATDSLDEIVASSKVITVNPPFFTTLVANRTLISAG